MVLLLLSEAQIQNLIPQTCCPMWPAARGVGHQPNKYRYFRPSKNLNEAKGSDHNHDDGDFFTLPSAQRFFYLTQRTTGRNKSNVVLSSHWYRYGASTGDIETDRYAFRTEQSRCAGGKFLCTIFPSPPHPAVRTRSQRKARHTRRDMTMTLRSSLRYAGS